MRRLLVSALAGLCACLGIWSIGGSAAASTTQKQPVFSDDFPDPFVLTSTGTTYRYYAFATGDARRNIRILGSNDLTQWVNPYDGSATDDPRTGEALPALPAWSAGQTSQTWGPEVVKIGSNWLMYYSTLVSSTFSDTSKRNKHCISVATSTTGPAGPYTDALPNGPLVCSDGGSIDPTVYQDPSTNVRYLAWKGEPSPSTIWSRQLSTTGLAFAKSSSRHALLYANSSSDGGIVEAPDLLKQNGKLYLFYSSNAYWTSAAFIGYATCSSPISLCSRKGVLEPTGDEVKSPGGASVFTDATGQQQVAFHAWYPWSSTGPYPGYGNALREMFVANLSFSTGAPTLGTWLGQASG